MSGPVGRSRRVGPWMSSSLQRGPTSFRKRFAAGRLGFGDVVGILVAGTGACALALRGLDAVLVDHPVQATVRRPSAAAPILVAGDLGAYVGNWVSEDGAHLIVARSGAVWADGGGLIGSARLDGRDRTHLLVEGAAFRCDYRIVAEHPDALVWTVLDGTPGIACPAGRYNRRFTF